MRYLYPQDKQSISKGEYNYEAAGVVLINKQNQVLITLRDDIPTITYPGRWTIPGGHRESTDANLQHTAIREVEEEIEFKVKQLEFFVATVDRCQRPVDVRERLILNYIYIGVIDKQLHELVLHEGCDMRFADKHEIANLNIVPFIHDVLNLFFAEK